MKKSFLLIMAVLFLTTLVMGCKEDMGAEKNMEKSEKSMEKTESHPE